MPRRIAGGHLAIECVNTQRAILAIKLQLGVTAPRPSSSHQRGVVGHTEVLNMRSSPMSSPLVTFTDVAKVATASPHSPLLCVLKLIIVTVSDSAPGDPRPSRALARAVPGTSGSRDRNRTFLWSKYFPASESFILIHFVRVLEG